MPGPAEDLIREFGRIEADQRYTKLVDLFVEDGVYCDPLFGPQRGKDQILTFMAMMEDLVPKAGARFDFVECQGDTTCGWARWVMYARGDDGQEHAIPGQSLYRLRGGQVAYVADYMDDRAYTKMRPSRAADYGQAAGLGKDMGDPGGPALELVQRFWRTQDERRYSELAPMFTEDAVFEDIVYGRHEGGDAVTAYLQRMETEMPAQGVTFELIDCAGDETVAWSQWWTVFPGGRVPGWTLHTVRDGRFTLDADYFDVPMARELAPKA